MISHKNKLLGISTESAASLLPPNHAKTADGDQWEGAQMYAPVERVCLPGDRIGGAGHPCDTRESW